MGAPVETALPARIDKFTFLALFAGLVAYPVLYSTDSFGTVLFTIFPGLLTSLLDEDSRFEWWYFGLSNLAFHWSAFVCVAVALAMNRQRWVSLGVDWSWFRTHWRWFAGLVGLLVVAALVMPSIHYGDELPRRSSVGFIGPLSSTERLFMIVLAFTAAVTEEVIFRGFALTRLKRLVGNAWLALPLTAVSFVFIHGELRSVEQFLNYFVAGIAFGIPFILMKLKRLELVIVVHFLIDAALVLAP